MVETAPRHGVHILPNSIIARKEFQSITPAANEIALPFVKYFIKVAGRVPIRGQLQVETRRTDLNLNFRLFQRWRQAFYHT